MISALIGGVLQSFGQVVGAGKLVNSEVLKMATIFKIVRIMFIILVVAYLGKISSERDQENLENDNMKGRVKLGRKKAKKLYIPWYIFGFFILTFLKTAGIFNSSLSHIFHIVGSRFEIIALAGIGMRVKVKNLMEQGVNVMKYGVAIALVQISSALFLSYILFGKAA